ncbi:MAG: hypothetical protein RLZZ496_145 [Pseudomonadota bacterium]|jgi:hypothetical protein
MLHKAQKRLTFRNKSESAPDLNGPDHHCQRICKKRQKARDIPYRVSDILSDLSLTGLTGHPQNIVLAAAIHIARGDKQEI